MKYLLTSQMLYNDSITVALADMLGRPFNESKVTYIMTSHNGATGDKSWLMNNLNSVYRLCWAKFYMLDLAGVDGLPADFWRSWLDESDVIVMGGGANYILSYWLEKSGLLAELSELIESKVYVGASAGSMLLMPALATSSEAMLHYSTGNWGVDLATLGVSGRSSIATLKLVDFYVRPHYSDPGHAFITDELLESTASRLGKPLYALDDNSALKVVDGQVEVISEGKWKLFNP